MSIHISDPEARANVAEADVERALADTRELVERWKARPLIDPRPIAEILAYDEDDLPV